MTWANKTRLRGIRQALDVCCSATEVIRQHGELVNLDALTFARKELEFIEKHNIQMYYFRDENYPYRLAHCVDAPLLLYAKGHVDVNPKHIVSVVGTRMPSERGKDWCRQLVLDLA
ncbi:MAG: DNA-processing protein DprA, partial [Paludibacteraceae bacterium]|nr:DNA-processing protein DprA [Paludibacteraceae bacterium]